jgi:starch phosphorylase
MKASINGTLHCSSLDGWWPEGFGGKNGWSFGAEYSNDAVDARALYDTIEQQIVPRYYELDERKLPGEWVMMMKEAIKSISPAFSARRMMKEYIGKFYAPIGRALEEGERQ